MKLVSASLKQWAALLQFKLDSCSLSFEEGVSLYYVFSTHRKSSQGVDSQGVLAEAHALLKR